MKKHSHDVIVIGGGSGGLTAVAGFAQLGLKTLLIEQERLGGDCLFYGCVPSKTLIKSAKVYNVARHAQAFGLPRLDVPPVDAAEIMAHVNSVIEAIAPHDSPERFRAMGADVRFGSPRFLSPHEVRINGQVVSAPSIVLATGSEPSIPPIPGLEETGYVTNKTIFSLRKFPRRLATIGGGPIGIELSQALARLGVSVTVLEALPQILPNEDPAAVAIVHESLRADGIEIRTGARIVRVERAGDCRKIHLADGHALEVDDILVAAGRKASLGGLDLQEAGVGVERGFITTDSHLSTTQKHILAVGDCNGRFLFTHVAGAEASLAVRRIAFHLPIQMDYNRVPWCTYTDPEIASVGYNETRAAAAGVRYSLVESAFLENDRALAESEAAGKIRTLLDDRSRVIGTQVIGAHAGDLLAPALFAVNKRWSMSALLAPMYPYPTMSESYRKIAGTFLGPKLFNGRVRTVLRLLFGYRGAR